MTWLKYDRRLFEQWYDATGQYPQSLERSSPMAATSWRKPTPRGASGVVRQPPTAPKRIFDVKAIGTKMAEYMQMGIENGQAFVRVADKAKGDFLAHDHPLVKLIEEMYSADLLALLHGANPWAEYEAAPQDGTEKQREQSTGEGSGDAIT